MDGVARLCPAARGGSLERDRAETTITCLDTQDTVTVGTQKAGLERQRIQGSRSRVLVLAQSSGEGLAPADPGAGTSTPGVGTRDPQTSPKGQAAVPSCQGNGKGPLFHILPHLLVSQ